MAVISVEKDLAEKVMVVIAEFHAPIDRVWQLYADPRKLERWWGPPTHPATVVQHEFVPGGRVTYFMTGPDGDRYHGWWRVIATDPPRFFEVEDGFADEHGTPNADLPTMRMHVALSELGDGTRAVITSTFPSTEAMEQVIAMGVEEGLRASMGQMDAVLAE